MTYIKRKSDAGRPKQTKDPHRLAEFARAEEATGEFVTTWAAGYFAGYTHKEVAELVGCAVNTVTRVLGGKRTSLELANKLQAVARSAKAGKLGSVRFAPANPVKAADTEALRPVLLKAIARIAGDSRAEDGELIAQLARLAAEL